jgi:YfiR/HmsC-like
MLFFSRPPNWLRRVLGAAAAACAAAAGPLPVPAQELQEYEVKAAYLFNFGRFTEWPAPQEGPVQLCVLGRDPFGTALGGLEGRTLQNRTLHLRRDIALADIPSCSMLFISESEERRLAQVVRAASAHPILTVSDIEGFTENGGMIGLYLVDQRVQFDVNLGAIRQANLKLPAQVLKLARQVVNSRGHP